MSLASPHIAAFVSAENLLGEQLGVAALRLFQNYFGRCGTFLQLDVVDQQFDLTLLHRKLDAIAGAQASAPHLPRGLLLDSLWDGWLATAQQLGCQAVVCNHALWDAANVTQVHNAGMRCLSYTVNDEWAAQRLIDLGTDGIITDRVDLFSPV